MNSQTDILFLLNDALYDTSNIEYKPLSNNLINTNILNKKKYDELPLMCYNFADEKNNLINYLKYKKQKLYNKLSRRDYDDYREVLQDIYYFYEFNLKDINNINFDDPFIFKFNEIKSNIKYDYKAIKMRL